MKWVNESEHLVKGHPGIISGRKAKLIGEKKLFHSRAFYLYGEFKAPSKEEISSLIVLGQGQILNQLPALATTPEEAHIPFPFCNHFFLTNKHRHSLRKITFLYCAIQTLRRTWLVTSFSSVACSLLVCFLFVFDALASLMLKSKALHYVLDCISQYRILDNKHYRFLDDSDDESVVPMSLAY